MVLVFPVVLVLVLTPPLPPYLEEPQQGNALLHAASTVGLSIGFELSSYLDSDTVAQYDDDDYNILTWWHEHKLTYPVLSILAKDILTVPISTISSKSVLVLQVGLLKKDSVD